MEKVNPASWQKFSKEIQMAKETVQQLSKLYIIIHQKVKLAIKNSIVNSQYNFAQEAQKHIQFIKNILMRIRQAKNDEYFVEVQQKMLLKYEKSLLMLLEQIDLNLNVEQNKLKLDFQNLKRIKPTPPKQYDLNDQIMKSTKRMIRSKSGKRVPNNTRQNQLFNKYSRSPSQMTNTARQAKLKIQENVKRHIQVNKTNVSFQKKYNSDNLQRYLNLRKEFADLVLMDEAANKTNNDLQAQQKETQIMLKNRNMQIKNKLFPQFQIKTKFMKPKVKQNVMEVIAEVKMKLLEDYCNQNMGKIKEANQGGLVNLEIKANKKNSIHKSYSTSRFQTKLQSKWRSQLNHKKQRFELKGTNCTQNKQPKQLYSQMGLANKTEFRNKTNSLFAKSYQSQNWTDKAQKIMRQQLEKKLINNKILKYSK